MADANWVLTDVEQGIFLPEFHLAPGQGPHGAAAAGFFPNQAGWSVTRRTLRGGLSDGVDVIDVNNGRLQFSILTTRGMGLWKGEFEGLPIGWKSPARLPVHPAFVNQEERGGIGWLKGFNEWMCRCGLDSFGPPGIDLIPNDKGDPVQMPHTLHGKIANLPAHRVEVSVSPGADGRIAVTGVVDEASLFGAGWRLTSTTETTPGSNQLTIRDTVTNLRSSPAEFELLYHQNLGGPFLEKGSRIVAPVREVAPRNERAAEGMSQYDILEGPTQGFVEQVYFMDLAAHRSGETLALLRNAHGDKGVSLHFNTKQLPCFTIWKNTQAEADGYVTGLEPGTNYPNLKTYERQRGRLIKLPPGGSHTMRLDLRIHATAASVAQIEEQITTLQHAQTVHLHPRPVEKFGL